MAYDSVYMGVDAGTTKLKLMLYDNSLREIGSASRDFCVSFGDFCLQIGNFFF